MTGGARSPILVDTTALVAICKTDYDALLYRTLAMETTQVCNEEIKRQKGVSDDVCHREACRRHLELLRDEQNPDVRYVEGYEPHVENQGERTIEAVFRTNPDAVKIILTFDFDAIERLEESKQELGGAALDTRIDLPNYGFELLRRDGTLTTREYCEATYQMGLEEGWMKEHALRFDSVSPVDCPQFP